MQQSQIIPPDQEQPKRHRVQNAAATVAGAAHGLKEGLKKAQAVKQTAGRATRAPAHSKDDVKEAASAYTHSVTSAVGWYAAAGVIGAASFVVLTVGLVVAFNALVGVPAGYFLTVLVYVVTAGIFAVAGKTRSTTHREEAQEYIHNVRKEIRHVERPIKEAFHGSNG